MFSPSLLTPFLPPDTLSAQQLAQLDAYLQLLLRWNRRINLTAVRAPEDIVTRHFGESLFAARHLFPDPARARAPLADVGSGAGFPGLPIAIYAPTLSVTLIESQQKKAAFLKEAARSSTLMNVNVFHGRAEGFKTPVRIVTLRAVERFEHILPIAAGLLTAEVAVASPASASDPPLSLARPEPAAGTDGPAGPHPNAVLCLLIGAAQVPAATRLLPGFQWDAPLPIPQSANRALLLGRHREHHESDK